MALFYIISILVVAVLAILYQVELNYDPMLASASVTLMRNREDSFKYATNIPQYEKVNHSSRDKHNYAETLQ